MKRMTKRRKRRVRKPLMKSSLLILCTALLATAGVVSGTIKDQNGNVIPRAKVAIPALNIERIADENGYYSLSGVPSGTYDVLFGADNYKTGYLRDVTFEGTAISDGNTIKRYSLDLSIQQSAGANRINFVIPQSSNNASVRISIYNLKGREISQIVNAPFAAGFHSVDLPSGIAPGMYAVKLSVSNKSIFQKMITY